MSKRILLAALLAGLTAACQQQPPQTDVSVVSPGPVSVEPVYQGKYGS